MTAPAKTATEILSELAAFGKSWHEHREHAEPFENCRGEWCIKLRSIHAALQAAIAEEVREGRLEEHRRNCHMREQESANVFCARCVQLDPEYAKLAQTAIAALQPREEGSGG